MGRAGTPRGLAPRHPVTPLSPGESHQTIPEPGRHVPAHGGRLGLGNSSHTDVFRDVSYLCIKAAEVIEIKKRLFGDLEEVW